MQLEKILEEIEMKKKKCLDIVRVEIDPMEITIHREQYKGLRMAEDIIRKHMNDGWISVEEPPKKDYTAVFAVDKHDYYFVAVYDKEHGYRTNDVGADVDNIVAYCLFNPYCPERSDNHDGE